MYYWVHYTYQCIHHKCDLIFYFSHYVPQSKLENGSTIFPAEPGSRIYTSQTHKKLAWPLNKVKNRFKNLVQLEKDKRKEYETYAENLQSSEDEIDAERIDVFNYIIEGNTDEEMSSNNDEETNIESNNNSSWGQIIEMEI